MSPPAVGTATLSTTTLSAAATADQPAPTQKFTLTIAGAVGPVTVLVQSTGDGIVSYQTSQPAANQYEFNVLYRAPASLPNNTYSDTLVLRVCADSLCQSQLAGSPFTIRSSYTVSGDGGASIAASGPNPATVRSNTARIQQETTGIGITTNNPAGLPLVTTVEFTRNVILALELNTSGIGFAGYSVRLTAGSQLPVGRYTDTITIRSCYSESCARQVQGSPLTLTVTYVVSPRSDLISTPMPVAVQSTLAHDVVGALFSRPLDRLLMIAALPSPALHIRDIATGTEHSVALAAMPLSISLSPDGRTAVIGHDGTLSFIDIARVGAPGAPGPVVRAVAARAAEVVFDRHGVVHVLPEQVFGELRSVNAATGADTGASFGRIRTPARARLQPGTDFFYSAWGNSLQGYAQKWDSASGVASLAAEAFFPSSPMREDYIPCGNLWFHQSGSRFFGTCGAILAATADPATDMTRIGDLDLSAGANAFNIAWLDHSAERDEIAVVEHDTGPCLALAAGTCQHHLTLFDGQTLARRSSYDIGAMTLGSTQYLQRGMFVFHNSDGRRRFLLSRLDGQPAASSWYLTEIGATTP